MCGDPWQGPIQNQPGKDNKYALGVITGTYTEGQDFTAKIQVGGLNTNRSLPNAHYLSIWAANSVGICVCVRTPMCMYVFLV